MAVVLEREQQLNRAPTYSPDVYNLDGRNTINPIRGSTILWQGQGFGYLTFDGEHAIGAVGLNKAGFVRVIIFKDNPENEQRVLDFYGNGRIDDYTKIMDPHDSGSLWAKSTKNRARMRRKFQPLQQTEEEREIGASVSNAIEEASKRLGGDDLNSAIQITSILAYNRKHEKKEVKHVLPQSLNINGVELNNHTTNTDEANRVDSYIFSGISPRNRHIDIIRLTRNENLETHEAVLRLYLRGVTYIILGSGRLIIHSEQQKQPLTPNQLLHLINLVTLELADKAFRKGDTRTVQDVQSILAQFINLQNELLTNSVYTEGFAWTELADRERVRQQKEALAALYEEFQQVVGVSDDHEIQETVQGDALVIDDLPQIERRSASVLPEPLGLGQVASGEDWLVEVDPTNLDKTAPWTNAPGEDQARRDLLRTLQIPLEQLAATLHMPLDALVAALESDPDSVKAQLQTAEENVEA